MGEAFRIQSPTFDEGGVAGIFAELRQASQFLRQRNLQVMAGNSLVISDSLHIQQQAMLGIIFIDIDMSWARSVCSTGTVVGGNGILFPRWRHRNRHELR